MPLFRYPIYDRVLVNLIDGSAIDGVLIAKRGPLLVLAQATLLTDASEPQSMDGHVYVERAKVLFVQAGKPRGG
jgi:hypothetical protein